MMENWFEPVIQRAADYVPPATPIPDLTDADRVLLQRIYFPGKSPLPLGLVVNTALDTPPPL